MRAVLIALVLVAATAGCEDKKKDEDTTEPKRDKKKDKKAAPSASSVTPSPAPPPAPAPAPVGPFVRQRPEEAKSVDACAFIGGLGMACLDAFVAETDPVKKSYMRRLSDSDAAEAHDAKKRGEPHGVAHAEIALACADSGPCKQTSPDGNPMDDGYACLTKAEAAWQEGESAVAAAAQARACNCDPGRAIIPVMGGVLACDGPDKPSERGKDMSIEEAKDVRACATCDATTGAAACQRELERLDKKDAAVASYLRTVHIPRCQQP
jgi:hypothetical protein